MYVAVGKKMINISKKIYLTVGIWKFKLEYTFLVVPGLSSDFIIGADFLNCIMS